MSVSAPVVVNLQIPGTLSTSSVAAFAAPFSGKIAAAYAAVTTAPVGSALTANVLVGADTAAAISIAASGTSDEGSLTAANCDFVKGSIITLDVTAVGSGTAGANMTLSLVLEATPSDDATFAAPVAGAHDHRFGQPANDYADFHDPN